MYNSKRRLHLHEIDPERFSQPQPSVLLPSLPFSWERASKFDLKDSGPFETIIAEQSKPPPQPAYAWWESLTYLINRAISSSEAVPLIELTRQYGRFGSAVRLGGIALVRSILSGEEFSDFDTSVLFEKGELLSKVACEDPAKTRFLSVPQEYLPFLNPVLRYHPWDESVLPTMCVVDQQGICYIVLANYDSIESKPRKREFDGLQAIANAVWKEARTDIFDIPICCSVDYLCFRIIAAPLQFWLPHEEPLFPYLSYNLIRDNPTNLWQWQSSNPDVIEALERISKTIPGSNLPYLIRQSPPPEKYIDDDVSSLLISSYRQKLTPYCPVDLLPDPPPIPSDEVLSLVADKITNFECLITSPIVLRSLLREHSIKVRYIGLLLLKLDLPVMKQIIVSDMIGRRAKWYIRRQLYDRFVAGEPLTRLDIPAVLRDPSLESSLLKSASEYFNVPLREIEPFYTGAVNPFLCNYTLSGVDIPENRSLFPQYHYVDLLAPEVPGFFPRLKIVHPDPAPYIDVNKTEFGRNPIDYLPLKYASLVYRLEAAFAIGDVLETIVVIGDLALTIMKMREIEPVQENKDIMRSRILSLCIAARELCPVAISVPTSVIQSIIDCVASLKLYENFRADVIATEGSDTITVLSLDNQMAKCVFDTNPSQAIPILRMCSDRCERSLGARHPVTIASWIRLGQAIKKTLEMDDISGKSISFEEKQTLIRDAIKCLNKATKAAELTKALKFDFMLDHASFAHYLLSIFYLWNGEPGKAVEVSRQGLEILRSYFSSVHPRYLNSAFLHAKLLEKYASSTNETHIATSIAREARDLLEEILDALLDLTDDGGSLIDELFTIDAYLGGKYQFDKDLDLRRKLAITALIIKMNIWLLDPPTARDLLDLVVADYLTGSRGILDLPRRIAVRDAVVFVIEQRTEDLRRMHSQTLPVLEMTTVLPEPVMGCLNMALTAKANGTRVSGWFNEFREKTMMTIGDGPGTESSQFRDLLTEVFLTFVYIESDDCVFIGPLSSPIVPRKKVPERITSQGHIYRLWERSATLYTIDHGLYPIHGLSLWNGRIPQMTRATATMTSDELTTKYVERMAEFLGPSRSDTDPYIRHISSKQKSVSIHDAAGLSRMTNRNNIASPTQIVRSRQLLQPISSTNLSERNLFCMAVKGEEVVVGGADHAAYVLKSSKDGKLKCVRKLYTKKSGHTDWVSAVGFLADGRVVSAGMDSKICVWRGTQSKDLIGHVGSISNIKSVGPSHIVSSSYDRSLKIWNSNQSSALATLHGHKGAVLDLEILSENKIASVGRDGLLVLWDIATHSLDWSVPAHVGHATCISSHFESSVIVTGGQDGTIRLWDTRDSSRVFEARFSQYAAVTMLARHYDQQNITAVAANDMVCIFDFRTNKLIHSWVELNTNHLYAIKPCFHGSIVLGTGNGRMIHRGSNGELLSDLAVDTNAVRCVDVDRFGNFLLATDDGNIITL